MTSNDIKRGMLLIDREKKLNEVLQELERTEYALYIDYSVDDSLLVNKEMVIKMFEYELGDIHLEMRELGIDIEDENKS